MQINIGALGYRPVEGLNCDGWSILRRKTERGSGAWRLGDYAGRRTGQQASHPFHRRDSTRRGKLMLIYFTLSFVRIKGSCFCNPLLFTDRRGLSHFHERATAWHEIMRLLESAISLLVSGYLGWTIGTWPWARWEVCSVEFDDGDSGRIALDDIRVLQPDYPVVGKFGCFLMY